MKDIIHRGKFVYRLTHDWHFVIDPDVSTAFRFTEWDY